MNKTDLLVGVAYHVQVPDRTRNQKYVSQRGMYIERCPPSAGNKRSRKHRFNIGGQVVSIDASKIIEPWSVYQNTVPYQKDTLDTLIQQRDMAYAQAMSDHAEMVCMIVGTSLSRIRIMSAYEYRDLPDIQHEVANNKQSPWRKGIILALPEIERLLGEAGYPVPKMRVPEHLDELVAATAEQLQQKKQAEKKQQGET